MIRAMPGTGVVPVLLADGRPGVIRPLDPTDEPALRDLAARSSEESLYRRFFSAGRGQADAYAHRLCTAPDVSDRALVLEVQGSVVGMAAAEDVAPGIAEVAFLVEDAMQGRGVGTLLLINLAAAQRRRGVTTFEAEVLGDNMRMLGVFVDAGYRVVRHHDGEIATVQMATEVTDSTLEAIDARERRAEAHSLRPLLAPRTVAVVGAGRQRGGVGREVLENILAGGFTGHAVAVNPGADSIGDVASYPDLASVPDGVDLAVVAVPAPRLAAVVEDARRSHVGAMVILSAGLAETGQDGRRAQQEMVARALSGGLRVVGPNCLGVLNTASDVRLNATFSCIEPSPGGVAIGVQSGGVGIALIEATRHIGLGVSRLVSLGNKADVSGNDLLAAWTDDPEVTAAVLYLESFGNPAKFARLASRFSRRKPLLAVRSGTSEAGRLAGTSHTAGAVTSATGVDALFAATGVIAVDDVSELASTARLLTSQPVPGGPRLGVVSNAGGLGILAADGAGREGLTLPPLSVPALDAQGASSPSGQNPLDLGAAASPDTFGAAAEALLEADDVDASLFVLVATRASDAAACLDRIGAAVSASDTQRPTVIVAVGMPDRPAEVAGVPVFDSVNLATRSLGNAWRYGTWLSSPPGQKPPADEAARAHARESATTFLTIQPDGGWLDATASAGMLTAYGVDVAQTTVAGSVAAAIAAAERITPPVVMKTADPNAVHKTELGLVRTGLVGSADVRSAFEQMAAAQGQVEAPVLVQQQVPAGVEIAIGMVRDPVFGPIVMLAAGGVTTDVLADRVFLLPPITDADASKAVRSLRIWPLLAGFRGSPAGDVPALEATLQAVAQLAGDVPELVELDLNPVMVTPESSVCVDVKARLAANTAATNEVT
jgi:acyl-CoA synthetase (NDP forming)/GNAT superfamily N-acetyltransferase